MKNLSILFFLILLLISCKKESLRINSNVADLSGKSFHYGDQLNLQYNVSHGKVDSMSVFINNQRSKNTENIAIDSSFHYGDNSLKVVYYYDKGKEYNDLGNIKVLSSEVPAMLEYILIKSYPHQPNLFTEGLFISGNTVYESSGLKEKSFLCKYALGSSEFSKAVPQYKTYFSEGIAPLEDKIFQLTWRSQKIFEYNGQSLDSLDTYLLPAEIKEGWGFTSNGTDMFISNGTSKLYKVQKNGNQFEVAKTLYVVDNQNEYKMLNELEYVKGSIFSNVWKTNTILQIDAHSGIVKGILDISTICAEQGVNNQTDKVANGIAVLGNGNLLITGKFWDKLYEIKITN